jgi:tetratricopeptide (TPR) repeat protein
MHTEKTTYRLAANFRRIEWWPGQVAKPRRKIPTVLAGVSVATAIMASAGPGSAQGTASSFDSANSLSGEYYDNRDKFGFNLDGSGGVATATASNSPRYSVGQVMLRFKMVSQTEFVGEQLFTDGKFHQVAGTFLDNGDISMRSRESGAPFRWTMLRVKASPNLSADGQGQGPHTTSSAAGGATGDQSPAAQASDECDKHHEAEPCGRAIRLATAELEGGRGILGDDRYEHLLMYRAGAYFGTKDYPRAIADYGAMIEAARGRTAYLEFTGLFLRGSVYSEQGTYDLALRDLKAALAMSDGNLADIVRAQINEVKKKMAQSGSAPLRSQTPRRFVCHDDDHRYPQVVTVDPGSLSLRIESTTNNLHLECVATLTDGANAPVYSGPAALHCAGGAGNPSVPQEVEMDDRRVTAIVGGELSGKITFDLETGILRTPGSVSECEEAGRQ